MRVLEKSKDKDLTYFTVLASGLINAKFLPPSLRCCILRMFILELRISLAVKIFFDQPKKKNMLEKISRHYRYL